MFRRITVSCFVSFVWLCLIGADVCPADEEEDLYRTKENICRLIEEGKFAQAKQATDLMAVEFVGQEKLPEMLYWVAERYERNDQFDKASIFYQRVIQDYPQNQYTDKARLNASKSEIMALIMAGRYDEAHAALDKYIIDFASHLDLPRSLFFIAERYQRMDKFDEARQIYQRIIENYPNNPYVNRAKIWLSRTNVSSLIVSGNYAGAQETLDKLVADFAGSGDLPENLFWITERYERQARFEDARQNYQRIIQNFPYSTWARRARLGISRAEVIFLVESGDFNQADAAINKMAGDFAKNSDMPWSLYLIAEKYKKANRSEDVNRIYQQIMQNYPDSLYASKVKPEIGLPQEQETQNQFSAEAEKNAVELYRLARKYESSDEINLVKQTYEQIVTEYPGTIKGEMAVLDILRLKIQESFNAGDESTVTESMNKFVEDFKRNPYAALCLRSIALELYKKARLANLGGDTETEKVFYRKAIMVWERLISAFPDSEITPDSCYALAICYAQELGEYQTGIDYLQKIINKWPDYEYAQRVRLLIAEYTYKMGKQ